MDPSVETDITYHESRNRQEQEGSGLSPDAERSGSETLSSRNKVQLALETILLSPAQLAANAAVNTVGAFIPKMEKLPWPTFFSLSFLIAIP